MAGMTTAAWPRRAVLAALLLLPCAARAQDNPALAEAVASPTRTARFAARDSALHPLAELSFFGIAPDATVVEIWPGGGYWTEILAPYLRERGHYIAALPAHAEEKQTAALRAKLAASPALFDRAALTVLDDGSETIAPPGTADAVLTFRNLHNWMQDGTADAILAAFFRALKPGGVLGLEDHRARPDKPQDPKAESGYVRQDYAIALAEKAGFVFEAASEIAANPKDTTDWPKGVWTLPPTFRLGAQDHDFYAAIGEADNFVLRFRKPK